MINHVPDAPDARTDRLLLTLGEAVRRAEQRARTHDEQGRWFQARSARRQAARVRRLMVSQALAHVEPGRLTAKFDPSSLRAPGLYGGPDDPLEVAVLDREVADEATSIDLPSPGRLESVPVAPIAVEEAGAVAEARHVETDAPEPAEPEPDEPEPPAIEVEVAQMGTLLLQRIGAYTRGPESD